MDWRHLFMLRLTSDAIHSTTMAPTVEVMRLPMRLSVYMPNSPNSHPPSTPPAIPSSRFRIHPNPPPRISLPARAPATIPISINQIKFIVGYSCCLIIYHITPRAVKMFDPLRLVLTSIRLSCAYKKRSPESGSAPPRAISASCESGFMRWRCG